MYVCVEYMYFSSHKVNVIITANNVQKQKFESHYLMYLKKSGLKVKEDIGRKNLDTYRA